MSISARITSNTMSPDLAHKLHVARNPRAIWQTAGLQVVSLAKRAFRDPSMRQSAWREKAFGLGPSNLIRKGTLRASLRIVSVDTDGVTVGSDRKYAAIHQLGGKIVAKAGKRLVFSIGGKTYFAKSVKIPARPFFPFTPSGEIASMHRDRIGRIIRLATDAQLTK